MFEHIYITGVGIAGYVIFYVPLALFATRLIYRFGLRKLSKPLLRRGGGLLTASFLLSLPLWDVIAIGREAEKLCKEQAGLKVYRVVEAEGFLEAGGIGYWSKYGFSYVESGGTRNRKFREAMLNGSPVTNEVPEFTSRYQSKMGDSHVVVGKHFARTSYQVVDRQTQEVLGELVVIGIYPGWLDNVFIALTGTSSGFRPWTCGDKAPMGRSDRLGSNDVILATIKPKKFANLGGAK